MMAPAKVNLFLHVLGRRDDGYHLLDSLVVFADIGDEVTVRPEPSLSLEVDGPFAAGLASDQSNLVLKAALALQSRMRVRGGAAIRLTKNLPLASGIGGGSSDAAATLRALMELWNFNPGPDILRQISVSLGADVPVCLAARASFIGGIGEAVVPAGTLPGAWMLLANPGIATPTSTVFKARIGAFSAPARWSPPPSTFPAFVDRLKAARNDLTDAAVKVTPVVADVLNALGQLEECRLARLSGSGATCFGLFENEGPARAAESHLRDLRPDWWVRSCRMMP